MFFLLGDSHTRSYKEPDYIATRIFLAQGRKNNFHTLGNFLMTTARYVRAAYKLKPADLSYAFVIGEPDIRKILYGRWDIGRLEEDVLASTVRLNVDNRKLDKLCAKVRCFLFITKLLKCKPSLVIGCGTPNPEMIDASIVFNQKLALTCKRAQCLFFDPQQHAVSKANKLLKSFLGYSAFNPSQKDHTHLSESIGACLSKFLQDAHMQRCLTGSNAWRSSIDFEAHFDEVKNFNTYKMKDFWAIAVLKKIKRHLFKKATQ